MPNLCDHCLETEAALAERDREIERLREWVARWKQLCGMLIEGQRIADADAELRRELGLDGEARNG